MAKYNRTAKGRARNAARERGYHAADPAKHRSERAARLRRWRAENRALARERWLTSKWRKLGIVPTHPRPDRCEICDRPIDASAHRDHDHHTKRFRGWLCANCNKGLGLFRDCPRALIAAADYVLRGLL